MALPCGHTGSLQERQKYPLRAKIALSKITIERWYTNYKGQVYLPERQTKINTDYRL